MWKSTSTSPVLSMPAWGIRAAGLLRAGTRVGAADYVLLGLIILGAGLVRVWHLDAVGFNSDEAVYSGQAAAMIGDSDLVGLFPIFRAHPLLFQSVLALSFAGGVETMVARLVSVAIGLATVLLTHSTARLLYGRWAGLLAAAIIAVMPYHVVVTRQVLLDGPMTFLGTLALYLVARFGVTQRPTWLYAAGGAMGLTFLAKETGIILLGAIYAFLALAPELKVRLRDAFISLAMVVLVILPFPLSLMLAGGGGSSKTGQYLVWQLFRRPNHDWWFYPSEVPWSVGPLVLLAALAGLWILRREGSWREKLLVAWILVPIAFFQLWPVKGYQYLLPTAPAIAILAARAIAHWASLPSRRGHVLTAVAAAVIVVSLIIPTWSRVDGASTGKFLAGSGGVPGGREAGEWIRENTVEGVRLMTIGPSMANVLQFYGHRPAFGLSVSANPLRRNPSYEPIRNPDYEIRTQRYQYLVWDAFSASRSAHFSEKLREYASRYNGQIVYQYDGRLGGADQDEITPLIIIYQVRS